MEVSCAHSETTAGYDQTARAVLRSPDRLETKVPLGFRSAVRQADPGTTHPSLSFPTGAPLGVLCLCLILPTPGDNAMGQSTPLKHGTRPPETPDALEWAEIAGLVDIRPDGSWQMTDFAKEWFDKHPPCEEGASSDMGLVSQNNEARSLPALRRTAKWSASPRQWR
jgi:hypothetical protein